MSWQTTLWSWFQGKRSGHRKKLLQTFDSSCYLPFLHFLDICDIQLCQSTFISNTHYLWTVCFNVQLVLNVCTFSLLDSHSKNLSALFAVQYLACILKYVSIHVSNRENKTTGLVQVRPNYSTPFTGSSWMLLQNVKMLMQSFWLQGRQKAACFICTLWALYSCLCICLLLWFI